MQETDDTSYAILGFADPSGTVVDQVTQMVAEGLVSGQTDDAILRQVIGSQPKVPMVPAHLRQFVRQSREISGIGDPVPTSTWRGPFAESAPIWDSPAAAPTSATSNSDSVFDDDEDDELLDAIFSASPEELAILASKSSVNHVAHLKSTSTQDLEVALPPPEADVTKETSITRLLGKIAWSYARRGVSVLDRGIRQVISGRFGSKNGDTPPA